MKFSRRHCVVRILVLIGFFSSSIQIGFSKGSRIHLDKEHLKFFFASDESNHETFVHITSKSREKRSTHITENPSHLELSIENPTGRVKVNLQMNRKLISSRYNRVVRGYDGVIEEDLRGRPTKDCFYVGTAENHPSLQVALSNCDGNGFTGVLVEGDTTHLIRPANNTGRRRRKRQADDITPEGLHVIRTHSKGKKCAVFDVQAMTAPRRIVELEQEMLAETIAVSPHIIRKRQLFKKYEIETAVFVDDEMYSHILETVDKLNAIDVIEDIVFSIMNGVALLYDAPSLKLDIDVVVIHLDIMKRPVRRLDKAGGEILGYLNNFCRWQADQNYDFSREPGSVNYLWDHAILITGVELYDKDPEDDEVIGLAWVSGMCRRLYSCTINQGTTFEAVYVITHEMGHNLGMSHDGIGGNQCPRNSHIMSSSTGPGKVTWSVCSNRELATFLTTKRLDTTCLSTRTNLKKNLRNYKHSKLPGEKFDEIEQCQFAYGAEFEPYITSQAPYENICRELWCQNGTHALLNHPALEGTPCDRGKGICTSGACLIQVEPPPRGFPPVSDNEIPRSNVPQVPSDPRSRNNGFNNILNSIANMFRKYLSLRDSRTVVNLPQWALLDLSRCSAKCGGGWQVGRLACISDGEETALQDCIGTPKPPARSSCNTRPCMKFD